MQRHGLVLFFAVIALAALVSGCSRKVSIEPGAIVFLGDSLTAGYGLDPRQAYPQLIKIEGMTPVNLGVSGSGTADGSQRLTDYFNSGEKPRLVVIALGANDILHGVPMEIIKVNLENAIQECKSRGIPVMLCGIQIPGKFQDAEIFRKVASEMAVPLLPNIMLGVLGNEGLMQDDRMHPSAAGQSFIAGKVEAALRRSFSFGRGQH